MIKFILGMMCGGAVGVVFMALCNAASAADRHLERLDLKAAPSLVKPISNGRRQSL